MNTWPYTLRAGHSWNPADGACAMDAINWLVHGKHGDRPECACRLMSDFVIGGNDTMPDDTRQRLLPYLHRIAGSRSEDHIVRRSRVLWLAAMRVFAPLALDAAGRQGFAGLLRTVSDDVPFASAHFLATYVLKECRPTHSAPMLPVEQVMNYVERSVREPWAAGSSVSQAIAWTAKLVPGPLVWDAYFVVLDEALSAGPQGEPWSADVLHAADDLYRAADGLVMAMPEGAAA